MFHLFGTIHAHLFHAAGRLIIEISGGAHLKSQITQWFWLFT